MGMSSEPSESNKPTVPLLSFWKAKRLHKNTHIKIEQKSENLFFQNEQIISGSQVIAEYNICVSIVEHQDKIC